MIRAQHNKGHGITFTSPISGKSKKIIGLVYVDNTNLCVGLNKGNNMEEIVHKGQQAVTSLGKHFMAIGSNLNPKKFGRIWEEAVYTVATIGGTRPIVVGHGGPTKGKPY